MSQFWQLFTTVGKAVVKTAKYVLPRHLGYFAETAIAAINNHEGLARQYEEIQFAQLKLQYLQHQENLDFQEHLAKLNHERAKELQTFIQLAEDTRLQKQRDFERWRLQQEKALQVELLERNEALQRELVAYQRQSSLKVVEEQKRLENSPVWLVASDILNSHPEEDVLPLRVFFAPPRLQFERFASAANAAKGFPDVELTLAEGLRQFFRNYTAAGRSIDFLAGAWVSKSFHSEASIKALFGVLKSEPTLVLESEVDGDYLNFRIAYWGLNWSKYRYEPVISQLPYRYILSESAKARAKKWLETRNKLIAAGENPEEVDTLYGGDNVENLETWQREERFRQAGIDVGEVELNYVVNKKDFEQLCQFLVIYHCLFAGLVIDEYFLFQYNLPPLLPLLISDLTANVPDSEVVEEMTQAVISYYQNIYQIFENQRTNLMPELALDLAQSLAHLPNKIWAQQQIIYSVKSWLKLRNLPQPDELNSLLEALLVALTTDDIEYIEKLNQCLAAIGYSTQLSVEEACYQRGMSCCKQEDYEAAILDFNQAIDINSEWAEAYYNRGLAYAYLEQYQEAIEDYTQAIQIDEWADAFNNRGNAYYKLGDYKNAVSDYNRAIVIDPDNDVSKRNRDIAQGVLEELERKQRQEEETKQQQEEYKRWIENLSVANTLTGHSALVRCLAISPDGKILASGSYDDTIKLWELDTGKNLRTLTGHSGDIEAIAISPDGQILASGGDDGTIKLWNLNTGQEIRTLKGHYNFIRSIAISPDGKILASGSYDDTIKLWELDTGKEIQTLTGHRESVQCLAFSPDGDILASGSHDRTINLWQLNEGKSVFKFSKFNLTGHLQSVYSIVFSPNGQTLFSGSADNIIKQWQISTGKEICTFKGHSNNVYSLAISPDGQTLVSSSADYTIKIWQLNTGQVIRTLKGHLRIVNAVVLSPDGQTLVSGSGDIKIWRSH